MAKIELKGTIQKVGPIQTVGGQGTKKQVVILKVPAFRDQFGDQVGKDEEWELQVFGDRVKNFNLNGALHGKRAKCTVYVNSKKFVKQSDGTEGYAINATLGAIEVVAAARPAAVPEPAPVGTGNEADDDLPF